MYYNQDTPHPRGVSSIRKRVNPLKQTFQVTGMTCSACSAHVEKAVNKLEAVSKAEVSLMTNSMSVEYNADAISPQDIIHAVEQAGYGASLPQKDKAVPLPDPNSQLAQELSAMKRRLIWSFVFLIPLFYISKMCIRDRCWDRRSDRPMA